MPLTPTCLLPLTPTCLLQVDLEKLDADAKSELAGCGALACLEQGDGLFIPSAWWHHVHSTAGNHVSISLNFWFDPSQKLHDHLKREGSLPSPPTAPMHSHIAREIEGLAAACIPQCSNRAKWFYSIRAHLEEGEREQKLADAALDANALSRRNFVLHTLVQLYGVEGAAEFCRAYLDPRRWSGLSPVCFLETQPEVNGPLGEVIGSIDAGGRLPVLVGGQKTISLQVDHLEGVAAGAAAGKPPPTDVVHVAARGAAGMTTGPAHVNTLSGSTVVVADTARVPKDVTVSKNAGSRAAQQPKPESAAAQNPHAAAALASAPPKVPLSPLLTSLLLLLTTYYLLPLPRVQLSPPSDPLLATYYSLLTTYYVLLTTYYLLLTTYYLLLTTHYSLLTTHYLLLTTYYLKVQLSPPSDLSATELQSLRQRLLFYLEPLRAPPHKDAPACRLQCNLSAGSWVCVHTEPPIYTCDDFLSAIESEELIRLANVHPPVRSKTAGDTTAAAALAKLPEDSARVQPEAVRSSSTCTLDHIWPQCASLTCKIEALTQRDWTHFEPIALTRYRRGERYTVHHDGLSLKRDRPGLDAMQFFAQGGQRVATVLCYLNDVAEGGATAFPKLGIEVKPKRGRCLLFFPGHLDGRMDEATLHEATPAVDVKWVAQVWVRARMNPIRVLTPPRWPRGISTMTELVKHALMG